MRKLIGRGDELDRVQEACRQAQLVTLTGVGGVGKTRLALQVATALQSEFADGAWLVELSPLQDGRLLPHTIAQSLPLTTDQTNRSMIDVLAEYLADRELLLVWDTCEHLTDACSLTAQALLLAAPGLCILTTSRRPLGVPGEQVLALEPLPVGDDCAAVAADAVTLLADRAAEAVPGFTVTDANRDQVLRLSRHLEGLPLAIELAAARLRDMPLAVLNTRLEDRFAVLGTTEEAVHGAEPPWHQALHTAIGWSHQLCSPAERLAWARLSVFAGTFDAEAVRQVCADAHLPDEHVPAVLAELVDTSVLIWLPTGDGERYRMLDTIREYGAFWLRGLGEEDEVRLRHRDYYRRLARRADAAWIGRDQFSWYDRMNAEHDNLRAALEFSLDRPEGRPALELAGALWFFWFCCGFFTEGQHYLNRALAADPTPSQARRKALWARGLALLPQGDNEAAAACAAIAEYLDDADAAEQAQALSMCAALMRGDTARVAALAEDLLAEYQDSGELNLATLLAQLDLAYAHTVMGNSEKAIAVLEQLSADCHRHGERWMRAHADLMRAQAELACGRPGAARVSAQAALAVKQRLNDSRGVALAVVVLAQAAANVGQEEYAAYLLGLAQQIRDVLGKPQCNPLWTATRRTCEQQARDALGNQAYTAAFRAGYESSPDTALTYALDPGPILLP
ncbi:ATP-binding protein [Streptomyces sp. NPDC053542]|uniref:ATP-binding protein n=1 Tax=Streptomyces sp. NPDC053542 TaxID=3365710 RepID=UPI0037D8A16B